MLSCSKLILHNHVKNVSLRAFSSGGYLVDDPKYSFLKNDLKLERVNAGVYNGKWFGNGPTVKTIGKYFYFLNDSIHSLSNNKPKINWDILNSIDPATGRVIAEVVTGTAQDYEACVKVATDAYKTWSNMPAPQRGEIVRQIGGELRKKLEPLGKLVSLGKRFMLKLYNFLDYYEYFVIFFRCRNG